jgi:type VI secretion system protein ImpB
MSQSINAKFFEKNRPPRVNICFEVERYGPPGIFELPLVVGVMADLSDTSDAPLNPAETGPSVQPSFEERDFIEFTSANFDQRMASISPRVVCKVTNAQSRQISQDPMLRASTVCFKSHRLGF